MELKMNIAALEAFLVEAFPQVAADFAIDRLEVDGLCVRLQVAERHLRQYQYRS